MEYLKQTKEKVRTYYVLPSASQLSEKRNASFYIKKSVFL
jgi:hypothetical protein